MLKRFVDLWAEVVKPVLEHFQYKEILGDEAVSIARRFADVLEPAFVAVEGLSKKGLGPVDCDRTVFFMLKTLVNYGVKGEVLAGELAAYLCRRYMERRPEQIYTIARYLTSWNYSFVTERLLEEVANKTSYRDPSRSTIKQWILDLAGTVAAAPSLPDSWEEADSHEGLSLSEKMSKYVGAGEQRPPAKKARQTPKNTVENEIAVHECGESLGQDTYIGRAQNRIASMVSTSIDSERAFSVAVTHATKIRSTLGPKSLHVQCFLQDFFACEMRVRMMDIE